MQSRWAIPGRASGLKPPSPTSGEAPPPAPPDPPDQNSPRNPNLATINSSAQTHSLDSAKTQTTTYSGDTSAVENFTIIPPKSTSPLVSNGAFSVLSSSTTKETLPLLHHSTIPITPTPFPTLVNPSHLPSATPLPQSIPFNSTLPVHTAPLLAPQPFVPTLAEQIRVKGDKSFSRLASIISAGNCRPRVLIHDSVFQKGAYMHKDFIICYFNGRSPPFSQIQSVFNHMWRKAQWAASHSPSTPTLSSIKIWAHLTGIPLDLRHQEGLSLVAGLVGDPKETDDFTLNLASLTLSHVKVELDFTKPLPRVVEFSRQSGEVVEVLVDYPWLPTTCSHCHKLGHIVRNCLKIPLPVPQALIIGNKHKGKSTETPAKEKTVTDTPGNNQYVVKKKLPSSSSSTATTSPSKSGPSLILKTHTTVTNTLATTPIPISPFLHEGLEFSSAHLMSTLCGGWHFQSNHLSDDDGRIILIWKDPLKLRVLSQTRQIVTCEISLPNCSPFIFTAVYASNLSDEIIDL
ncbi:unnamed protein product [Brassica oleracea]